MLVFSTLLIANEAVYTSESQRLHAATLAGLERAEVFNSHLLVAGVAFNALANIQAQLQKRTPTCAGWDAYSASLSQQLELSVVREGVLYRVDLSAQYTNAGAPTDNLTLLAPFSGYENGSLNILIHVSSSASAGRGYPYYNKSEQHYAHLPVALDASSSLCMSLLQNLRTLPINGCSDSELQMLRTRYDDLAVSQGLRIDLARLSGSGDDCLGTSYQVTLTQDSEGVAGEFAWKIVGAAVPSP